MKPKDYLVYPTMFGKSDAVELVNELQSSEALAASIQSKFSFYARKAIKKKYGSLKKYCAETNQNYQRVGQVLRGSVKADLADFSAASANLNLLIGFSNEDYFFSRDVELASDTHFKDAFGAYYTPDEVSDYMVKRIASNLNGTVLEPSFGDGSFLRALLPYADKIEKIVGCEIDSEACRSAIGGGLLKSEKSIFFGSFFDYSVSNSFNAVIGNPPFVRFRNMEHGEVKKIQETIASLTNLNMREECSEWLPFLIKAACHLEKGGSLAFVLPYDFTYVKYARETWEWLGNNFSSLEICRSKERLFEDILQDVVLLFASGKGGRTETVLYRCFETRRRLLLEDASVQEKVGICKLAKGVRAFQEAMVSKTVLDSLSESPVIVPASSEADFHIGYVCGNKDYFHPSEKLIKDFSLPESSLIGAAMNSRQFQKSGVFVSSCPDRNYLWNPQESLSVSEQRYVEYGEEIGVNSGYKCRVRSPWWKVPGVAKPELIMSVFGEIPKVLINDSNLAVSNSLLGVYLKDGVENKAFCASWYTPLTLLSMEMQIHSLGGGVMIAVPREASSTKKIASTVMPEDVLSEIDSCLMQGNTNGAYMVGLKTIEKLLGKEVASDVIESFGRLKSWRTR